MAARELAEPRQQPALQELARYAQVQHAADPFAADTIHGATQFVEPPTHTRQEFGALLGQGDRTRVTTKQGYADVGLEGLDLGTDGGRRHAELASRRGKTQVRRDRLEHPKRVEWQALCSDGHLHRLQ